MFPLWNNMKQKISLKNYFMLFHVISRYFTLVHVSSQWEPSLWKVFVIKAHVKKLTRIKNFAYLKKLTRIENFSHVKYFNRHKEKLTHVKIL